MKKSLGLSVATVSAVLAFEAGAQQKAKAESRRPSAEEAVVDPTMLQPPRLEIRLVDGRPRVVQVVEISRVLTAVRRPSALVKGEFKKALEGLNETSRELRAAPDVDTAMRALDEAMRLLMRARAALRKQKDEAKGKPNRARVP